MKNLLEDYGIGTVVESNEKYSPIIEVFLQSQLPTISGDVKAKRVKLISGNEKHSAKATTEVMWNSIGHVNRLTAPSMFPGEQVRLQRYVGTDIVVWEPLVNNGALRKQECAIFSFSNVPVKEEGLVTDETAVVLEIDTLEKFVEITTPNNDGEPARYAIKLDYDKGVVTLQDDLDNIIELDSPAGKLTASITEEVIVNTKITTVNSENSVVVNTKKANISNDPIRKSYNPPAKENIRWVPNKPSKMISKTSMLMMIKPT